MDFVRNRPGLAVLVVFIAGLVIGLVVLGWGLFPVQWTNGQPKDLAPEYQATYIETTAIAYSTTGNEAIVANAFRDWPDATNDICTNWSTATNPEMQAAIDSMINVLQPGQNCTSLEFTATGSTEQSVPPSEPGNELAPPPTADEEGGTNIIVVLGLFLLLLALVGGIYYVMTQRNKMMDDDEPVSRYELPDEAPTGTEMVAEEGVTAVPIARFTTTYDFGRDNYDDSFGIENTLGDFLGECGVGISESLGSNTPKNITAFEVWLFDKSDIRTETKVLMSDHAFFDEALKAKLAPKGEPVLGREGEVIVLETASLIINAVVKEMQYGSADMPPQSYFELLTLEISAWAKEPDSTDSYAEDVAQDDADALNY